MLLGEHCEHLLPMSLGCLVLPRKMISFDRISTNQPSSDPSMCPGNSSLARPLAQSSSLHYLPITGSRHSLYLWLPSGMNAGISMNEACTHINYTQ